MGSSNDSFKDGWQQPKRKFENKQPLAEYLERMKNLPIGASITAQCVDEHGIEYLRKRLLSNIHYWAQTNHRKYTTQIIHQVKMNSRGGWQLVYDREFDVYFPRVLIIRIE